MPKLHLINNEPYSPAEQYLAELDADWAQLIADIGGEPKSARSTREPYEALVRAVAHQQLHGKAAENILGRFVALYPNHAFPTAQQIVDTGYDQIRACGFSNSKTIAILGIAEATVSGIVPTRALAETLENEELITRLTSLRGIGRWTVEIFLMHSLHRPDILPVDDFGVREGWRVLKGQEAQLKPKALAIVGEAWSPYRTTAAWYLWRAVDRSKLKK